MVANAGVDPGCRPKLITIDEILHARPQLPKATTRGRGWDGVTVDVHRPYYNCSEGYPGLDHHLICYCPSGRSRLMQIRAGTAHEGIVSAGMSYLMPAGHDSQWEGDSGLSVRLRMPVSLLAAAGEQLDRRSVAQIEIQNVFETWDPVIERVALSFVDEMDLAAHPAQNLIVDSISTALAAHMIRRYNVFDLRDEERQSFLGRRELERLTSYVEDNVGRPIKLSDLAEIANVSCFHFARMFKKSTGYTAIQFVERRRIDYAKTLITETDLPLAQIALAAGFADQSHFTRRFRRHIGCTPAVFARDQGRRRSARRPGG